MKKILFLCLLLTPLISEASSYSARLEELKMRKRFAVGVAGGGGLSIFGLEVDINLSEEISVSGGIGTGLQYNTMMGKIRYFLLGEWVSPYIGVGVARWWSTATRSEKVTPGILAADFLGNEDPRNGFNVVLVYPALGVQFMHATGLSVYAELQYLFKLFNFVSGAYAGLGVHWYF